MNEAALEKLFFKTSEELLSYSDSFESRSRDRFITYVKEINDLGSHSEYDSMFHADRILLNNKSRRLSDFIEVKTFVDRIEIVSLNEDVTASLINLIKTEKGFKNVKNMASESKIVVILPPMTMNQKLELNDATIAKRKGFEKNLIMVKAQTVQQVQAGLRNEYIAGPEAAKVGKEVERIINHYARYAKLLCFAKQKIIVGKFTPENPEEKALYKDIAAVDGILS